jgi:hypothetical protein
MRKNAPVDLNPEQELVLASIRLDRAKDERIGKLLKQELDWAKVIQYARLHNVLPLLYHRLKALGAERVCPQEMDVLKVHYLTIIQRNLRLVHKLISVIQLLSGHKIASITFKGPALALQAYNDLSLRSFEDLDILVHKADIPQLYDLLTRSGYNPMLPLDSIEQKWWVRTTSHFGFSHAGDLLEFHWTPIENGFLHPLQIEHFWQEFHPLLIDGQEVRTLSAEDNLLLLCLHGTKHEWYQLKWIADLAYLIQSTPDMDWQALLEQARKSGFLRIIGLSLVLAERTGGATIPSQISSQFQDDQEIQKLARQIEPQIVRGGNPEKPDRFPIFFMRGREQWEHRLYYIVDQLFLPKWVDRRLLTLPEALFPLYFVIRPIRLVFKFSWIFICAPLKH